MKKNRDIYSKGQRISSVLMILALLWLTVSTPFVFAGQQAIASEQAARADNAGCTNAEDATNPFGNNTEEKAPSSTSFSEEYLHDHNKADALFSINLPGHNLVNAGTYTAYHGELLVPPPNVA